MNKSKVVCLWSGPRNISTTMMYSFAQRNDTQVFDEPLYGYYLKQTSASDYHPDSKEVIQSMNCDGPSLIDDMLNNQSSPVMFYKQMTHHLLDLPRHFLDNTINIILTRDPWDMIQSFAQVIESPTLKDLGYKEQLEMKTYLSSVSNPPLVMDSKEILLDPEKSLRACCEFIGVNFDTSMLNWEAGARAEDGVWAKHWYSSVHKSTGFLPYKPKSTSVPDRLFPLYNEAKALYDQLLKP